MTCLGATADPKEDDSDSDHEESSRGRYEYEYWPKVRSKVVESDNLLLSKFGVNASDGIYLCSDREQQAFLLDAIKKDRVSGLVPFKLMLNEGTLASAPEPIPEARTGQSSPN